MTATIRTTPEYVILYWDTVIGPQYDAEHAVQAFDLVPSDLRSFDEWLSEAQTAAEIQGAVWPEDMDVGGCARQAAAELRDAAYALAQAVAHA